MFLSKENGPKAFFKLPWRALPQVGFLKQNGEKKRGEKEKKKQEGKREEKEEGKSGASTQRSSALWYSAMRYEHEEFYRPFFIFVYLHSSSARTSHAASAFFSLVLIVSAAECHQSRFKAGAGTSHTQPPLPPHHRTATATAPPQLQSTTTDNTTTGGGGGGGCRTQRYT